MKEKDLKLVYLPKDSNWKYCYDGKLNCIWYIAHTDQCNSGIFGNIEYFRTFLKKEIKQDETRTGRITALGFKILGEN